jgi:hypothetical protein
MHFTAGVAEVFRIRQAYDALAVGECFELQTEMIVKRRE